MISYNYEVDFQFDDEELISNWLVEVIKSENFKEGDINYVFCNDNYLQKINLEFLNHDTLTDIISFDYSVGKILHGDIFISIDRVRENAKIFNVLFNEELKRVMVHGVLHYCGYKDKSDEEILVMRQKENHYLSQYASIH